MFRASIKDLVVFGASFYVIFKLPSSKLLLEETYNLVKLFFEP